MAVTKKKAQSSSSSDSGESSPSSSPAPQVKRQGGESSSSDSEDSSSSQSQAHQIKQEAEESSGSGSESGSGSDSESSDSGSDSEDEQSGNGNKESEMDTSADNQPSKKKASQVSFVEPQAFKPPPGFKPTKKQSASSNVSSILSDLRGKQVFHITAPSFLPLSKVKEASLGKILQGEPVLQFDGVDYGIPQGSINQGEDDGKALLLHDPKTQKYYNTPVSNIPSYHVQEMLSLPADNGTASLATKDYEKPTRKQVKNLKMRFRPVGSGNAPPETIGSSSESEAEDKPSFKFPTGSSAAAAHEKEERKRKHHHADDASQTTVAPRKKSKKHSSSQEDQMDTDKKEKSSKKSSKSKDEKKRKKAEKA